MIRAKLWSLYEGLAMGLGLGFLGLLCLGWLPAALLLSLLPPAPQRQRRARTVIGAAFRLYLRFLTATCATRIDLTALRALQDASPRVLIANHPSLIDVILIVSQLPNTVCIMKASLRHNPLLGPAARLAGYIRNDGPLELVLKARTALAEGAHVLIFPEGGRTRNFPLDPFGPAAALIAQRAGVPLQPCVIWLDPPYLGKRWPLWRKPSLPWQGRVEPLDALPPPTDLRAASQRLEAQLRAALDTQFPPLQYPSP
ncbi:lysophospholipid acyltransferase family protein [Halothiobacillus sp. DCM-1]|uniref:lysophospholipid acyltransferase family protein n=1 Tax=Halothiobacillus sp. DCM-1 TaxID=3112558 RepID=UPI0032457355